MRRFYFDHNATTPVYPEVLDVFLRVSRDVFGNASSIHQEGQSARSALDSARREVAALLRASEKEVVFTSGGTEANNLAILGSARSRPGCHIVTSQIEHPAVLRAVAQLEKEGHSATYVKPRPDGRVDPDDFAQAVMANTGLISLMHVNNETGVIQPIEQVAAIAHSAGAIFHSDGVQAAGRIDLDMRALAVDLYSISAHKIHAPKGAGAVYVRKSVKLQPIVFGGRHESGLRAGTENVAAVAALGEAARVARKNGGETAARVCALRDRLERSVLARISDVELNGTAQRVANTVNLSFPGIEGEAIVIALDLRGIAVSSGSACSSGAVEPSHVLLAMGLHKATAKSSIRFSLGPGNSEEQVDTLVDALVESVSQLRRLSPVYASHA